MVIMLLVEEMVYLEGVHVIALSLCSLPSY